MGISQSESFSRTSADVPHRARPKQAPHSSGCLGRSKQAFKTWLAERREAWREGVEVPAMDGVTVEAFAVNLFAYPLRSGQRRTR